MIEFLKEHENHLEVSGLISHVASDGGDAAEKLQSEITTIALDNWWPPYNEHEMESCRSAIQEEKSVIFEKTTVKRSMEGKDDNEKARLIAEYTKRMQDARKNRKKKNGGNSNV